MSFLRKIEAKLDVVNKRLEAAQRHIEAAQSQINTLIEEKRRLDHARGVVTELIEEDSNGVKEQNDSSELSRPKLIIKILENSTRALRSGEIRDIALKEYGREIPPAPINAALGYNKRSGRVTNSDGVWSIVANPKEKSVTANDASSPPQPERSDPAERSEDDDSDNLFVD